MNHNMHDKLDNSIYRIENLKKKIEVSVTFMLFIFLVIEKASAFLNETENATQIFIIFLSTSIGFYGLSYLCIILKENKLKNEKSCKWCVNTLLNTHLFLLSLAPFVVLVCVGFPGIKVTINMFAFVFGLIAVIPVAIFIILLFRIPNSLK